MKFEKKDLKIKDKIYYRDGGEFIVNNWFLKHISSMYNEDLTDVKGNSEQDIVKVSRNGVVIFDREQQERQAKIEADHEARAVECKAKKDAGNYAFDSEKAYTTEEIEKKINGFTYEKIQFDFNKFKNWFNATLKAQAIEPKDIHPIELLRSLPESVQLVIVNAMSEEQKTSLIGK